jgi:hypothetical protein
MNQFVPHIGALPVDGCVSNSSLEPAVVDETAAYWRVAVEPVWPRLRAVGRADVAHPPVPPHEHGDETTGIGRERARLNRSTRPG